jgi:hypothetical protein
VANFYFHRIIHTRDQKKEKKMHKNPNESQEYQKLKEKGDKENG